MSDRNDTPPTPVDDPGAADDVNSTGSGTGQDDIPWAAVDSGQSDDIENSLSGQGVSDRETVAEVGRDEQQERSADDQ